jgi:hypothetical protein
VFDHRKALDIALNGTRALAQRTKVPSSSSGRNDPRQNPTDIDPAMVGLAQGFEGFLNNHTANAIV